MPDSFSPLWRQVPPEKIKKWVKDPQWKMLGTFFIESLGSCRYGLTRYHYFPIVIADDDTVWEAQWPNLMVSLDDQMTFKTEQSPE